MSTDTSPDSTRIFALTYVYADDAARMDEVRPAHRAFLRELHEAGTLVASGPFADAGPAAALILLRGESADALLTALEADPFFTEGLIAERSIRPWNVVIGDLG